MKVFIAVLVLIFGIQSLTKADDISEFEIEGMSIGDSLLNFVKEKNILTEIEVNKYMYAYASDKFGEVYISDGSFDKYDTVSVFVKTRDKKYIIYRISASIDVTENMSKCNSLMQEVSNEFSRIFINAKKNEFSDNHPVDETGRSKSKTISFIMKNGDIAGIQCNDFEESLRKKNNWFDSFTVAIQKKEVEDWFKGK